MQDERWQQLVEMVKKHFANVSLHTEDLIIETPDGPVKQGTKDVLELDHPDSSRYRLVRENRPVVLEKREHYTHRMGATAKVEYKHSKTEFSHKLRVYKADRLGEWEEITLDRLGL